MLEVLNKDSPIILDDKDSREKLFEKYQKKYEYTYDEYNDIYICPNEKNLIKTERIDKNGYKAYKASEHDCSTCPLKNQYTISKCKQILRHVWEEYKEMTNDYGHHNDVKEIYRQRSQHVERIFADKKMRNGLKYAYFRAKENRRQISKIFTYLLTVCDII